MGAAKQCVDSDSKGQMSKEETLRLIFEKMERFGDLPVFSATVNHICNLSADPTADAMQLSEQVLKDANLSLKLLRLANSPYYARGPKKINVVSRSIIVLGFETVKNLSLTLKLIESFQHEHPGIDMDRLLVQSFVTAGFARDLAIRSGIKEAEHIYTCALLHNLGEIAVSYFLPESYLEIQELNRLGGGSHIENEREVLGASFATVGKALATSWDFSSKVISTMDNNIVAIKGPVTKPNELEHVLVSLSSDITGALYSPLKARSTKFQEVVVDLSKATGIDIRDVESSLTNAFEQSCELARDYGLNRKKLMPVIDDTEEDSRDKLARQFSYYVSSHIPGASDPGSPSKESPSASKTELANGSGFDAEAQLHYIQEITSLITASAKLNTVLIKVLQGIHEAIGFKRVLLCLLTPDRKTYVGRIAIGHDGEQMKRFFNRPLDVKRDIFSKVIMESVDIVVEDVDDKRWNDLISPDYSRAVGGKSFIVAALRSGIKPLGFIYADTGTGDEALSGQQHRGFIQFVAQARLALQTCR